jgi:hypothetical protein
VTHEAAGVFGDSGLPHPIRTERGRLDGLLCRPGAGHIVCLVWLSLRPNFYPIWNFAVGMTLRAALQRLLQVRRQCKKRRPAIHENRARIEAACEEPTSRLKVSTCQTVMKWFQNERKGSSMEIREAK